MSLSIDSFAASWFISSRTADIRTAPYNSAALMITLHRDPFFALNGLDRRGKWVKVQFVSFVPQSDFHKMLMENAKVQELGYEGSLVQARITGWTKKSNLKRKGH